MSHVVIHVKRFWRTDRSGNLVLPLVTIETDEVTRTAERRRGEAQESSLREEPWNVAFSTCRSLPRGVKAEE